MPTCNAVSMRSLAVLPSCGTLFDLPSKQKQLDELTARMAEPGFWDVPECAQALIQQTKPLNPLIKPFKELDTGVLDLRALVELAQEDESLEAEAEPALVKLEKQVDDIELKAVLNGPQDASNAYLKIQAGTGGTEACDWAEMLLRMYTRW